MQKLSQFFDEEILLRLKVIKINIENILLKPIAVFVYYLNVLIFLFILHGSE